MIYFGKEEQQMLSHTAEVMHDRLRDEYGYEDEDTATVDKLEALGKSVDTVAGALVLTGAELDQDAARALFAEVVRAELRNWVPGASQRLIDRASLALDVTVVAPLRDVPECADGRHALTNQWFGDLFLSRCVTCGRLFEYQRI